MNRYNNYHKHTMYSSLFGGVGDSPAKPEEYIKRCVELGHTNYFTTDHGMSGDVYEANTLCKKYGIKCIFAIEGYIVENNDPELKDNSNYHIMLIAKTNKGRRELNMINSNAHMYGFYYKPRISLDDLLTIDKEDIYITTACMAGVLRDSDGIEKILMPLINHFGNHIYLEIQSHNNAEQKEINRRAVELAKTFGLKLIAANDSHYVYEQDIALRKMLMDGKRNSKNAAEESPEDEFILDYPDYDTMLQRFIRQGVLTEEQIRNAIDNTLDFDDCEAIDLNYDIKMPTIDEDLTPDERYEKLEKIIWREFEKIKESEHLEGKDLQDRIDGINYELKTIRDTNDVCHTSDYFLFNKTLIDKAINEKGGVLTRTGRGSCGSFYINRVLGITQIDRFEYNLPMYADRFISTARCIENKSMPDIDMNIVSQKPFVDAAKELLGEHSCYPMTAFHTMGLSDAFRNVCRAYELPFEEFNEVGKNIEDYEDDPKWKRYIDEAKKFVGVVISASVHPCSHIIGNFDVREELGIVKIGDVYCAPITSDEADQYKYLKEDFLIVTVWKLIAETFELIGLPIIPLKELVASVKDDERIWKLFDDGITCTCNQVDSDNGTAQIKRYKARNVEDVAMITAAIRPSFDAWRNKFLDREYYTTGSKQLDEIFESTKHFILYQECLMRYMEWLGISPAESIGLIKSISKKHIKEEDFKAIENRLKEGWIRETGSEDMFWETWEMIQGCMSYGFNAPHGLATALDAIYSAYLKVNYPLEYYTVCFNNYVDDQTRTRKLTAELDYFGLKIDDIGYGHSRAEYSCDKTTNTIYKGIGSVKSLNNKVAEELYELSKNEYNTFVDLLLDITNKTTCNKTHIDILIRLDFFKKFGEIEELLFIYKIFSLLYDKSKVVEHIFEGWKKNINLDVGLKISQNIDVLLPFCNEYKPPEIKEINIDAFMTMVEKYNNGSEVPKYKKIIEDSTRHKKDGTPNGINFEKFFKLAEIPDGIKERFATKTSAGSLKGFNSERFIRSIKYTGMKRSYRDIIKDQMEYLGYVKYVNKDLPKTIAVCTAIDGNRGTFYCPNTGTYADLKVSKKKGNRPIVQYDVIKIKKCVKKPKYGRPDANGNFPIIPGQFVWWLDEYYNENN